jgi:formylglycine-generating enzyme
MENGTMQLRSMSLSIVGLCIFMGIVAFPAVHTAFETPESYVETLPDTETSFEMVLIPGGEFALGSPDGEAGREDDEGPVRKVKISPFYMAKTEVSCDLFEEFYLNRFNFDMKNGKEITGPSPAYEPYDNGWGRETRPAIKITWNHAKVFVEWLAGVTGKPYRLPTEAEWEYAARAGDTGAAPEALDEYAWFEDNSDETTQESAQKKPNAFGLYDMLGNVWEYCVDSYDPKFYAGLKNGVENPRGPAESEDGGNLRGGSFLDPASDLRYANRMIVQYDWFERDPQIPRSKWWHYDASMVGIRLVCDITE